jgi:hypothetical protein
VCDKVVKDADPLTSFLSARTAVVIIQNGAAYWACYWAQKYGHSKLIPTDRTM